MQLTACSSTSRRVDLVNPELEGEARFDRNRPHTGWFSGVPIPLPEEGALPFQTSHGDEGKSCRSAALLIENGFEARCAAARTRCGAVWGQGCGAAADAGAPSGRAPRGLERARAARGAPERGQAEHGPRRPLLAAPDP